MKKKGIFTALLIILIVFLTIASNKVSAEESQLVIVNKSVNKTYFYENGKKVKEFSVATGKSKNLTPEGTFKVIVKWECPVYYKTNKKGCTSDNPLGVRWIGLNVPKTSGYTYGLHGTNQPNSIGTNASSGCIRMLKDDVVWLFNKVKIGTKVVITSSTNSSDTIAKQHGYKLTNNTAPSNPEPTKTQPVSGSTSKKHTVQKGDTLSKISRTYNVSLNNLKKWNNLNSDLIKSGQKLIVAKPTTTNISPSTKPSTELNKKMMKKVKVSGYLNVRSSATTSSKVIGKLKSGQKIEVTLVNNQWAMIHINGVTGYVSTDYLVTP